MADTTNNADDTSDSNVQPIRPSENFNAADADAVIRSCDNAEFRLHKKNLKFLSGGFPPADIESNSNEIVQLTLIALAEAAKKYEVFALIHIYELNLRIFMRQHPRKILTFAARHRELLKAVAPIVVPYLPLSELSTGYRLFTALDHTVYIEDAGYKKL
ncbi:hypothetical protein J3R30DRAFT_3695266 [Lentinula aciculospora]|uniref:BTB domain-containing protein n=1 Tax=Lentinula aciculospora TaxID=153920 RepID=A0A9W9DUZ1_9AGAR|nr:hypothetical protein J3R30DRAFT_3695266 [Lentinula aciculospora]